MQAALTFALCLVPLVVFPALLVRSARWGAVAATIYVLVYLPLSLQGQFLTANHGGMDWQDHWAPRALVEPSRRRSGRADVQLTWVGTQFWPLVVIDNLVWHRTHDSDLSK